MRKRLLLAAAALLALPATANAQSDWFSSTYRTYPGVYIGAQGGANWLLNNQSYIMDTGWTLGGKVGYDFVGPRVELEGMYHSNTGSAVVAFPTGYATVSGKIEQVSVMGNVLYDFFPGAMITPYIGGGLGVGFVDANIQGCKMCLAMFAYQGILGFGFNATPALRISLEGRYYGTTNPGAYFNNNIMALLSVAYKFGQPEVAPPPPPPAGGHAALVHGVLRLGSVEPVAAGADHDPAGGERLQGEGQCAHHGDRPHRHVGSGELQHGAVAASRQRGQGRPRPRRRAGAGDHRHRQGREPAAGADGRQRPRAAEPPRRDRRPVRPEPCERKGGLRAAFFASYGQAWTAQRKCGARVHVAASGVATGAGVPAPWP